MNDRDKKVFGGYFREIQVNFSRFYARELEKEKITFPQYALLNQLAALGAVSMSEIGARLYITKPAVTHLVDRLEKGHYLKRMSHPTDRRVFLLEIQPRGERLIRRIRQIVLSFLFKTFDRFSPTEQKCINRFYATLAGTIKDFLMPEKKKGSER